MQLNSLVAVFGLICLVSSSLTRRLFIANTTVQASTSSSAALKTDKVPPIKVALCIQRYAQLSPDMTQLEKDYSDMVTQLEMESSYLSDHELRHKRELFVKTFFLFDYMGKSNFLARWLSKNKHRQPVQRQQRMSLKQRWI